MTETVRAWLPRGVGTGEEVRAAVKRTVADWSEQWFGQDTVSLSTLRPVEGAPEGVDRAGWRRHGAAVGINCGGRAAQRVLGWALDTRLDLLELTDNDQLLIDAFGERLFGDLTARLETALGVAGDLPDRRPIDPFDGQGGVIASLVDAHGGTVVALALPQDAIAAFCRARAPAPRPATAPLLDRAAALNPETITLEAQLGRAELSLGELRTLAVGDVLVLNTGVGDAIDLGLPGAGAAPLRGRLTHLDGHVALTLQA